MSGMLLQQHTPNFHSLGVFSGRMNLSIPMHTFAAEMQSDPTDLQQVKLDRLRSIATLQANWNAYGALPIEASILDHLRWVFLQLADDRLPDRVVPSPSRGVQIEYEQGDKYLEIEFRPDGVGYLIQYSGVDEEDEDATDEDVFDLIERYHAAERYR